ncbi:MAG TPA: DUF2889 domain-containing protein [Paraburkholderia sp.]|jgi:hypothetical protein
MPLSPPASRQLRHRRAIRADAYERADGLWDIEACLTDVKPRDTALASGVRPNGLPIHELWLRITIDRKLNVVDAEASSAWVPYPGLCEASNPAYRALIGLNLFHNFRRDAARLLGGTAGCTHLTELCAVLPSAAIQAFAGDVWNTNTNTTGGSPGEANASHTANGNTDASGTQNNIRDKQENDANAHSNDKPPFQLGRCHTLRFDGEAVRQFYPRWYGRAPRSTEPAHAAGDRALREDGASRVSETAEKPAGTEVQSNSQTEGNHA